MPAYSYVLTRQWLRVGDGELPDETPILEVGDRVEIEGEPWVVWETEARFSEMGESFSAVFVTEDGAGLPAPPYPWWWWRRPGEKEPRPFISTRYKKFEETKAWEVVDRAIADLTDRQEISQGTPSYLIIDYLVRALTKAGLLPGATARKKRKTRPRQPRAPAPIIYSYALVRSGRWAGSGELAPTAARVEVGDRIEIEDATWTVTEVAGRYEGRFFLMLLPEQEAAGPLDEKPPTACRKYEGTPAWVTLDRAIADLVTNQDIYKRTHTSNIIGYIVNALSEAKLLASRA